MEMTLDQAAKIVKNYASNGSLFDGLEELHIALEDGSEPVGEPETIAYRTLIREIYFSK